jgi:hypothetical protein
VEFDEFAEAQLAVVVQPAGSAGAVTPLNVSLKISCALANAQKEKNIESRNKALAIT